MPLLFFCIISVNILAWHHRAPHVLYDVRYTLTQYPLWGLGQNTLLNASHALAVKELTERLHAIRLVPLVDACCTCVGL